MTRRLVGFRADGLVAVTAVLAASATKAAREKRDPYVAAAAERFGIPEAEVTPEQRQDMKAELFRQRYSGQPLAGKPQPAESRAERRAREREEVKDIGRISKRAWAFPGFCETLDGRFKDRQDIVIRLIQVKQAYGARFDLRRLLEFDDQAFLEDLVGILRHSRPVSGVLLGFAPRSFDLD